jgi:hypothetical protein
METDLVEKDKLIGCDDEGGTAGDGDGGGG